MPTSDSPIASVIITTKNRFVFLAATLKALASQTYPGDRFEVLVIDAGTDKTQQEISRLKPALPYQLRYKAAEGLSIAAARNLAVKEASGEYFIIIDDDVFPTPTFIRSHIDLHLRYPHSIVQGELLPAPGTALVDQVRLLDLANLRRESTAGMNHCSVHTFNMSCPREAFSKEYFDETIDQYGWEDVEWGFRVIKKTNFKLRYSREALAFHYKPSQTFEKVANENFAASKGIIHFLKNHLNVLTHDDSCMLKIYVQNLMTGICEFVPLTPERLSRQKHLFSLQETESKLFGLKKNWEELRSSYHEVELYAACEGAWAKLHDIPIEQSAFSAQNSKLKSSLMQWPISIKYSGPPVQWLQELSRPYHHALEPFCDTRKDPVIEIKLFPAVEEENALTPYVIGVCLPSLWKNIPSCLAGYREIWVPTEFDKEILSELQHPSVSVLPFGMDWNECIRGLLRQEVRLPARFTFFADGGYDLHVRGIPILLKSFQKAFKPSDHVALVLAFPKEQQLAVQQLLSKANQQARIPLITALAYESSFERHQMIAASDCIIYAGAGESIVPYLWEGAAMGKGILATHFGGHLDFFNQSNSMLLPCKINEPDWRRIAIVNEEDLIQSMRYACSHQDELKVKGGNAKLALYQASTAKKMRQTAFLKISETIRSFSPHEQAAFLYQ